MFWMPVEDPVFSWDQVPQTTTGQAGMTATSLLPLAAKTAGITFSQLLDKLIRLGIEAHHSGE